MGLLFRKRLRLSKWLSLNLSKSGVGLSVGPPGAKLSVNSKRARMQLGIPGTGIGYRRDVSMSHGEGAGAPTQQPATPPIRRSWSWVWLLLIGLLFAVWWLSGCATVPQSTQAVGPYQPSQTIELYDAAGRRTGYGKVQGGSIELFNPDGSRAGFGKVGR